MGNGFVYRYRKKKHFYTIWGSGLGNSGIKPRFYDYRKRELVRDKMDAEFVAGSQLNKEIN